jgi:hypothetical protein
MSRSGRLRAHRPSHCTTVLDDWTAALPLRRPHPTGQRERTARRFDISPPTSIALPILEPIAPPTRPTVRLGSGCWPRASGGRRRVLQLPAFNEMRYHPLQEAPAHRTVPHATRNGTQWSPITEQCGVVMRCEAVSVQSRHTMALLQNRPTHQRPLSAPIRPERPPDRPEAARQRPSRRR